MGWATFWLIFSQTHLVTLHPTISFRFHFVFNPRKGDRLSFDFKNVANAFSDLIKEKKEF
jgi:hypothetical protein